MALIGGAGNPVGGGAPAGTSKSLQYVGEHAYGNSGVIAPSAGDATAFDFTSASESYVIAKLFAAYDAEDLADANQFGYRIVMNEETVWFTRREAHAADQVNNPLPSEVKFIIPPETRIEVIAFTNGGALDMSFIITGRVYA